MNEQKAKCDAIERREAERRDIEEKKHAEEVQFLKRTNQQLKVKKKNRLLQRSTLLFHTLTLSFVYLGTTGEHNHPEE